MLSLFLFVKRKWGKNKQYSTRSAPRGIEPLFPTWRVSVLPIYEGAHYTCKRSKELNLVQQIMRLLCYLYTTSHFLKGVWPVRSNSLKIHSFFLFFLFPVNRKKGNQKREKEFQLLFYLLFLFLLKKIQGIYTMLKKISE